MWAIRALSGPLAGQVFVLKEGRNVLGRGSSCDVQLALASISKEHAEIFLHNQQITLSDLNSRNGVFFQGVKVKKRDLKANDKFSLHETLFDLVLLPSPVSLAVESQRQRDLATATAQANDESAASAPAPSAANVIHRILGQASTYFDNVVMPGIYIFAKRIEFRWTLLSFVFAYVCLVTLLASIPTTNLIKDSVQLESRRRAMTIAKSLAEQSRQALVERMEINVSTKTAESEEGVVGAFIISGLDGHVIAPVNSRNAYLADRPFVHSARHEDNPFAAQIDDALIGASYPIKFYNSEQGSYTVLAHAIILYDMGSMAINRTKTAALFLQVLAIALVLGGLLYLFLVKVIEEPLRILNGQLSDALREGRDDLFTPFKFPALQVLISNINSALNRIGRDSNSAAAPIAYNRDIEADTLVHSLPLAAMAYNVADQKIISANSRFDQLLGNLNSLNGVSLADLASVDLSLQQNLRELFDRISANPQQLFSDEIPFNGIKYVINAQAIMEGPQPAYILIWFQQLNVEGAA